MLRVVDLVYGEGFRDRIWLSYLRSLYQGSDFNVKIFSGGGGSPKSVVINMTHRTDFSAYRKKSALVDDDRGERECREAEKIARENRIEIIESELCLEFELLRLSGASPKIIKRARESGSQAKKEFAKLCGVENPIYEKVFPKMFPKEKLDVLRRKNQWSDQLICLFE